MPLRPRSKIAFLSGWESLASTDIFQILEWNEKFPDANAAAVALATLGGVWFFEVDRPEVIQRIEKETGKKIPKTFRVRSSPGRGHFYFRQSLASIKMGNIAQGFVKGNDWSARVDKQYVVTAKSLHPKTGQPYEVISDCEIVPCPQWLIDWMISQKVNSTKNTDDGISLIPKGAHDSTLTSIAGTLRNQGLDADQMAMVLIDICEKRCVDYGSDYKEMCEKIAHSVSRYKPAQPTLYMGGKLPGQSVQQVQTQVTVVLEDLELRTIPYPLFPSWVMDGTSLYEGFAKPYCQKNSRYPEFMWMPAMTLLLNYIGTRVRIAHNQKLIPSIFLALIGRRGEVIKSSSVESAIEYFSQANMVQHGGDAIRNAEGRTVVWSAGSPEGFGMEMIKTNCKNGVLFYDELSTLTNKAGIESSTMQSALLSLYESGKFQNIVKSKKEGFGLDPGKYCASLIVCSTDMNFQSNWSKLAGQSSGLDDRFFFLYQPEKFIKRTPQVDVDTSEGAIVTSKLINKAIEQAKFVVTDMAPLQELASVSNRTEIRAEKFALGFAIDLGREEIDSDCIERAIALIQYEQQVKDYVRTFEAFSREGAIQMEIIHHLQRSNGRILTKEIDRLMRPEKYGTYIWNQSYGGLIKNGWMVELGTGSKADPKYLVLLRVPEQE